MQLILTMTAQLRSFRKTRQLTLEELGARFGVNKTSIMRWEKKKVPAERVLSISKFTGIPAHELRPDLYPRPRGKVA